MHNGHSKRVNRVAIFRQYVTMLGKLSVCVMIFRVNTCSQEGRGGRGGRVSDGLIGRAGNLVGFPLLYIKYESVSCWRTYTQLFVSF